ncbi:MAG: hypothetical protein R3B99_07500 [Polyangiales bacterium]
MLVDELVDEADAFVRTPEHLDDVEASTLPCAGLTAWHALYESTVVRPGESVLALGSGGVSTFAIRLASRGGEGDRDEPERSESRAIARARRGRRDRPNDPPDWADEVVRRHGEVDHVIEVGGAGTLEQSARAVRHGGRIALIGVLGFGATASISHPAAKPTRRRHLRRQRRDVRALHAGLGSHEASSGGRSCSR